MKLQYKRKINALYDDWEDCKFTSLRKGDIFYYLKDQKESPFFTALSDVYLRPSLIDESKIIWHLETEVISDENFL